MTAPMSSSRHPPPVCGEDCAACRHRPNTADGGLEGVALALPAVSVFVIPILSAAVGAHLGKAWLDGSNLSQLIGGVSGFLTGVLIAQLFLLARGAVWRAPVAPAGSDGGTAGGPETSAEGHEIS